MQGHEIYVQGHVIYVQGHKIYVQGHKIYGQGHEIYVPLHINLVPLPIALMPLPIALMPAQGQMFVGSKKQKFALGLARALWASASAPCPSTSALAQALVPLAQA